MKDVPPDMEFEMEDDEAAEIADNTPRPERYEYAWEKVAATAPLPDDRFSFTCCGTLYRATCPEDIKAMFNHHNRARHGG